MYSTPFWNKIGVGGRKKTRTTVSWTVYVYISSRYEFLKFCSGFSSSTKYEPYVTLQLEFLLWPVYGRVKLSLV